MKLEAVYTIWLREMKRFVRSKSQIIGNIAMATVWLVIMGVGLNSSFIIPGVDFSYLSFMAPGIIGMALLFTSIFSGVSVIWDRQFGFLKEILVAPISRKSIVFGKMLGSATISLISGLVILFLSVIIGAIPLANITVFSILLSIVFMVLVSFSFVSIGLVIASKLTSMEGFQMIMSFLVMPLFFLSGAFFPIENTPLWMQLLAFIDPLFYGVDGIRYAILGTSYLSVLISFGVLVVFSIVMIIVSSYMFQKIE